MEERKQDRTKLKQSVSFLWIVQLMLVEAPKKAFSSFPQSL